MDVVGFCDANIENAKKMADEFGTDDAVIYTDYKEMLKNADIETVHICTPNKSHSEIAIAAMKADKHVMCEKPMAKTAKEAKAMVDAAKETGKVLTIAYQNRFRPDSIYLKKSCERGDLGEIYYAKAHAIRRRAVPTWGVFLNKRRAGRRTINRYRYTCTGSDIVDDG